MSTAAVESSDITVNLKNKEEIKIQHQLVSEIAVKEGFSEYEVEIKAINNKGGNYLGMLYEALISGKKDERNQDLHLFLKLAVTNSDVRDMMPLHDVYCTEIFAYKTIAKHYNDLQINEGIPESKQIRFPKLYGSIETNFCEALVLENLSIQKYTVQDRFKCITLDFAKTALETLAKFHAMSYVSQKRDPEFFDQVIRVRSGNIYLDNGSPERLRKWKDQLLQSIMPFLENKTYKNRIREFCIDVFDNIEKYVKINKHPALCHGDYRGNNLLVKYKKDAVQSIIAVDYQFIHFGSPIYDLYYFIYTTTDKAFRDNHLQYLIDFYYRSLSDFLALFSCDVEDIYPRRDFDDDIKSHRIFGLIIGVHLLQFVLVAEGDATEPNELTEDSFLKLDSSKNEVLTTRVNEIFDEFISMDIPLKLS